MHRIESSDNIDDVIERIMGQGIVVDPWSSVCMAEPERLGRYRWVVEDDEMANSSEVKKAA